ncbi:MAG: hypothetical protein JRG73_09565 [Deltaproteobacteria bacterium]|nr:hypothetical protein [Deltaproteobacteria bacterium]
MKRSFAALFIIILALFTTSPAWSAGDSLVIGFTNTPSTLAPYKHTITNATVIQRNIFDALVFRNPKDWKISPALAESWKVIDDTTWEFKLRKGVKFHNGYPFTARDVKFSYDLIVDPDYKSPVAGYMSWLKETKIIDDYTIRLITHGPYPLVLDRLAYTIIISGKWMKEHDETYIAENPMGTGPYVFKEWKKGEKVVLEANPDYWGKKPSIKHVTFKIVPEIAVQVADLITGKTHIVTDLPPDQKEVIDASGVAHVEGVPYDRIFFYQFDGSGRAAKGPFQDVRVRRAVNHAVDMDVIIKKLRHGMGQRSCTGVVPMFFGYDPTVKCYEYNPEKAKKLLAEAGYPDGFTAEVSAYYDRQELEAFAGYLAKVGIKTKINWYGDNRSVLTRKRRAGKVKDIAQFHWGTTGVWDADAVLYQWFHSKEPNCYNFDPQVDQWLDEARNTVDQKKRKELYSKIQHRIVDQAYWLPGFAKFNVNGINNNLDYHPPKNEIIELEYISWKK